SPCGCSLPRRHGACADPGAASPTAQREGRSPSAPRAPGRQGVAGRPATGFDVAIVILASNPPNPWQSQHRELLEPPPAEPLQVYEEQAKSVLTQNDSPDIPFNFSVNPYRGCHHACAYCYARRTHEYLDFGAGTDFERRIVAKVNAPELLRQELRAHEGKLRGEVIAFSGVTDCYQPLEASYQLT